MTKPELTETKPICMKPGFACAKLRFHASKREAVLLLLLFLYLLVLGVGTVAEIMDAKEILEWSFWRPPGKY